MPVPAPEILNAGFRSILNFDAIKQYHPDVNTDELYPQPGESYAAWASRLQKFGAQYPDAQGIIDAQTQVKALKTGEVTPRGKTIMGLFESQRSGGAGGAAGGPLDRNKAIDDFYRMMMDPNAPELQAAQAYASSAEARRLKGAGIGGGMANAGIARAGMDSRNMLSGQRQQAGINALAGGMGYDLQNNRSNFEMNQSSQGYKNAMDRDTANMAIAAGGQVISGVAGAVSGYGSSQAGMGGASSYGGYSSPASGMTLDYGGVGSDPATSPSYWNNPYGGY